MTAPRKRWTIVTMSTGLALLVSMLYLGLGAWLFQSDRQVIMLTPNAGRGFFVAGGLLAALAGLGVFLEWSSSGRSRSRVSGSTPVQRPIETPPLERIDFNLSKVLAEVADVVMARAGIKGLGLACEAQDSAPVELVGDPAPLRQILSHLLDNAVKFTEKGRVSVYAMKDRRDRRPGALLFSVSDTGCGVDRDRLERLFRDSEDPPSSSSAGAGGLYACRRWARTLGGTLWAESQPGEGTIVYFTAVYDLAAPPAVRPLPDMSGPAQDPGPATPPAVGPDSLPLAGTADPAPSETRAHAAAEPSQNEASVVPSTPLETSAAPGEPIHTAMDGRPAAESERPDQTPGAPDRAPALEKGRVSEDFGNGPGPVATKADHSNDSNGSPAQDTSAEADPGERRSVNILLADPSEESRFFILSYFEYLSFFWDTAENTEETVERFKSGVYDLIILDADMPSAGGLSVARAIRAWEAETRKENRTPMIMLLPATAGDADAEKCRDAGCDGHLIKPVQNLQLLKAIDHHIMSRLTSSPASLPA
jgi:CheY-like chemotaxis protein/anti-sigma regulatory factor (Ser/Thr protein kinase)